jgi:hypothetical protein
VLADKEQVIVTNILEVDKVGVIEAPVPNTVIEVAVVLITPDWIDSTT